MLRRICLILARFRSSRMDGELKSRGVMRSCCRRPMRRTPRRSFTCRRASGSACSCTIRRLRPRRWSNGQGVLELEGADGQLHEIQMQPGVGYHVAVGQRHRLCAAGRPGRHDLRSVLARGRHNTASRRRLQPARRDPLALACQRRCVAPVRHGVAKLDRVAALAERHELILRNAPPTGVEACTP